MSIGRKSSAGGKRPGTTGVNQRSAKNGRYVTAKVGKKSPATKEASYAPSNKKLAATTMVEQVSLLGNVVTVKVKRAGKGEARRLVREDLGLAMNYGSVVTLSRPLRVNYAYTKAQEQAVVRLAIDAQNARHDHGEDMTGLSDEDFVARLFR